MNSIINHQQRLIEMDILSEILSEEKRELIADHFTYHLTYLSKDNANIKAETTQEKIYCILFQGAQVIGRPDPLSTARENIGKLNLNELYLAGFDNVGKVESPQKSPLTMLKQCGDYYNELFEVLEGYGIEKSLLANYFSSNENLDELFKKYKTDEFVIKTVLTYISACSVKMMYDMWDNSTQYQPLLFARTSQIVVEEFIDEYKLWESSNPTPKDFPDLAAAFQEKMVRQEERQAAANSLVLCAFIYYYGLYSKYSYDYLFGQRLRTICLTPVGRAKFLQLLMKHEWRSIFVDEYKKYCDNNCISQLFDTSIISYEWPEPTVDKVSEHKDWFEKILYGKNSNRMLHKKLCELYDALVAEGFISINTPKELFVYRLSGFLPSFPVPVRTDESKDIFYIHWLKKPGALAYIVDKLYRCGNEQPKFSKIGGFFFPSYTNGKSQSNYNGGDSIILNKIIKEVFYK